jgi:hypothetical protein
MLDWDINHHLLHNFNEIIFQISTMMFETWIGTKNCQTMTIFCVDHSLPTPFKYNILNHLNLFIF